MVLQRSTSSCCSLMASFTQAHLRIIQINDVYELDYLPHFATCRQQEALPASTDNVTIGVMAGDFLAPSLLSSLDKGAGMVDCLNLSQMDYVSIGNHEGDVPLAQFWNRIRESKFTWINSNMDLACPTDVMLPKCKILAVGSKKVALLGLNTDDKAVFSPAAFDKCHIQPIDKCLAAMYAELQDKVDLIIPMTHQLMPQDRTMAAKMCGEGTKMPLIVGGHDHEPYLENINGCTVVKTGADGKKIAVIDVKWVGDSTPPIVTVDLRDCKDWPADPAVAAAMEKHKAVLRELELSRLCEIPKGVILSSKGIRLRPSTCGIFLCSILRDTACVDCCLIGAGSIRASRVYTDDEYFTYAHLKSEIPFQTNIVTLRLPGHVICDIISFTRAFALTNPPVEKGAYCQCDDRISWRSEDNVVTRIAGAPVVPDKMYSVCLNQSWLDGMDNVTPLMKYKESCGPDDKNINKTAEAGVGAKELIVSYFSKKLFIDFLQNTGFSNMDKDGDSRISKDELIEATKGYKNFQLSNLIINNLFSIADANCDGYIDKAEILQLSISAMRNMSFDSSDDDGGFVTVEELALEAKRVLCDLYDPAMMSSVVTIIDKDGNSYISKKEMSKFFEKVAMKTDVNI